MRISKEVLPIILPFAAIFIAVATPVFFPVRKILFKSWNFYAGSFLFIVILWTLWFFRDPDILVEREGGVLLSPASGKVLEILVNESGMKTVRIFMNVFDYHIQRSPCEGKVLETKYTSGSFMNAAKKGAHLLNERNEILLETTMGKIKITQVAGSIARRIVCGKNAGETVRQGDKIGMIKFGSQVDCEFPGNFETLVKEGERVRCAKTRIAKWKTN